MAGRPRPLPAEDEEEEEEEELPPLDAKLLRIFFDLSALEEESPELGEESEGSLGL